MIPYDAIPSGRTLGGRFVVEAPLGHGRSATVYRALDLATETRVALKVLDPALARDPVASARFAREVRILREVEHANVVKLFAFLRDGPWSIICMEYFEGMDWKTYRERRGTMTVRELVTAMTRVAGAVAACHRRGVLHRDLKPQNLLINAARDVKVVDFGVARIGATSDLTRTGAILGTPQYVAPETFASARPDPRSDVYALGAIAYEMLTGRPPYRAGSLAEIMTLQLGGAVAPLSTARRDVPAWLEAVVSKCLRTDPATRYQSAAELARDLERGERCHARRGEHLEPRIACLHCRQEILPRLPFCQHCGVFRELALERGRHVVVLERCDDPEHVRGYLARAFALGSRAARLRAPAVLARGISRDSAVGLSQQLAVLPAELRITERPALQLELPLPYAALALLSLVPLFWTAARLSAPARAGLVVGAELLLIAAYWMWSRPILRFGALRDAAGGPIVDPDLQAMAERMTRVNDAGLKATLGNLVRGFVALRARLGRGPGVVGADAVARAVTAALDAAEVIEAHETYLGRTSVADLHAELRAVTAELARTRGEAAVCLAERQTLLRGERRAHHAIQELHARLSVAIVNLQELLLRIDDALERDGGAELARELADAEQGLRRDVLGPSGDEEAPRGDDELDEIGAWELGIGGEVKGAD